MKKDLLFFIFIDLLYCILYLVIPFLNYWVSNFLHII
jgi:hypothetical protein